MENKANYALIGAFVLVAFGVAAIFAIWLSKAQFNKQYDDYVVAFDGGVRGLSQGSEVRFNGLSVGEVTDLRYDSENSNIVLAHIQVSDNTPVDTKAVAQLTPLGLTGLNYIEIQPGGPDYPLLNDLPGRGMKRIEGKGSEFDNFINGGGDVITAAQNALAGINRILSPAAIEDVHQILDNVNTLTASIDLSDVNMARLNDVMDEAVETLAAIKATAQNFEQTSTTANIILEEDLRVILARTEKTLENFDMTVDAVGDGAGEANELMIDARDAINRLSNSGITDLEETIDSFRSLILTLGRVADSLEQSPSQFIAGSEREEVVLPQ